MHLCKFIAKFCRLQSYQCLLRDKIGNLSLTQMLPELILNPEFDFLEKRRKNFILFSSLFFSRRIILYLITPPIMNHPVHTMAAANLRTLLWFLAAKLQQFKHRQFFRNVKNGNLVYASLCRYLESCKITK